MICTSFRQAFSNICTHNLTSCYWSRLPPFQISFIFLKVTYKMNTCCLKSWIYYVRSILMSDMVSAMWKSFMQFLRMPWISFSLLIFSHLNHSFSWGYSIYTPFHFHWIVFRCFTSSEIHMMAYYCEYVKDLAGNL